MAQDGGPDDIRALLRSLPSLRGPYAPVDWAAFPATPQDAFARWLADAVALAQDIDWPWEPHAMTVSTVDNAGRPDARVLILKNVDARGWHFAAQARSTKGRQLASSDDSGAGSPCALTLYWPPLARQVRIRGRAVPLPPVECAADFRGRPLASRISAVASRQSEVMGTDGDSQLDEALAAAKALFAANPDYVPDSWLVYAVDPTEVEFWQGATDRKHERLRYVRVPASSSEGPTAETAGLWEKQRLWP